MRGKACGPCTEWPTTTGQGYGVLKLGRTNIYVHIVSYTLTYGEYDLALVLDHLCGQRACFDPTHLEPVTFAENARRGQRRRWAVARGEADPFFTAGRERPDYLPPVPTLAEVVAGAGAVWRARRGDGPYPTPQVVEWVAA